MPDAAPQAAHDGTTIRIREAVADDLAALARLLEEIMAHHGVRRPPRERLEQTLLAALESDAHLFLVAEDPQSIVGTCSLIFTLSTWSTGPVCELQDVVVAEKSRRKGVGRMLLEAAEAVARSRGCVRLFLQAEPANLGAHVFYRSLGLDEKTTLHFERQLTDAAPAEETGRLG